MVQFFKIRKCTKEGCFAVRLIVHIIIGIN